MKNILSFLLSAAVVLFYTACNKVDDLPNYGNADGAPVLTASTSSLAPTSDDSLSTVFTLNWTNPNHKTSASLERYEIQFDTAGRNFAYPVSFIVSGDLSRAFTGKEINEAALSKLNFKIEQAGTLEMRVVAAYPSNNERIASNVITLNYTPYRIPPKVAVPPALWLVGDLNGWNNSSSLEIKYRFSKIDETTFAGVFFFPGGGGYKLIQQLGNWDSQFRRVDGTWEAGTFDQANADPTFPGAPSAGWYRVTVDFQYGVYAVEAAPARQAIPPTDLWIVGDLNGWNNSTGLSSVYKFTLSPTDPFTFTIDVDFPGGGGYKLIQELGVWATQFHMITGGEWNKGEFEQADDNPTFPGAPTAGNYRLTVNMASNQFWVKPN